MSFSIVSHLVDKTSGTKGTDKLINYMNTNPLFMNKPTINRTVVPEPSIREHYNIKSSTNWVDPTAFSKFTHTEYSSKNLQFKNYDRRTLMDDLKSGNPNYSNNFVNYRPAYLNNNGQPLFRNNSVIGSVYNFENNTPKNIPFNYPGPSIAAGSDPYYEPPTGGAPAPGPAPGPDPSFPPPPTRPPPPQTEDTEENNKFSKNLTNKLKNLRSRKDFTSNVMREKIIKERIDEMKKEFPQGSDKQLRKEVVKQINTTKRNIKNYEPTGNEHEPYTNKNIIERKKLIRLKQLGATLKSQNLVPRIRARLEGIRAVKALSSGQPPEETSKPAESIISEDVEASSSKTVKPSKTKSSKKKASSDKPVISDVQEASSSKTVKPSTKKDEPEDSGADSDATSKTTTDESKNMAAHKNKLASAYLIPNTVTDLIGYRGIKKPTYAILDEIAKELHSKNRNGYFLNYVSQSAGTGEKRSLKSSTLLNIELERIKKLKIKK